MGYSNLESEAPLETLPPHEKPPPAWPERGEIVLDDVSFRYSVDLPLVLKSLSFHIKPSEKVQCMESETIGFLSLWSFPLRQSLHSYHLLTTWKCIPVDMHRVSECLTVLYRCVVYQSTYMWQFRVEIEGYSVAYFDRIAAFEAPYH